MEAEVLTQSLQSEHAKKVKRPLQKKGKTTIADDFEVGGETEMEFFTQPYFFNHMWPFQRDYVIHEVTHTELVQDEHLWLNSV